MRSVRVLALTAIVICGSAGTLSAKPAQSTTYSYYPISGSSAVEIYNSMLKKGPRVDGAKAYAATSATTSQDGKLIQAKSCQIKDYRLKLDFVIKLPKIRNESVLPASDRNRWHQFQAFLKKHEETHRTIWLGCAAELERKVRAIQTKSCKDADRKAAQLWSAIRSACNVKHSAFDAAEQKKLMQHPFVRYVYGRKTTTDTAAAAAQ
jgi:predicted secreted Zn-dependent protease